MGLTKRQEDMIAEIIVEESRVAAASQQERHRILAEVDQPEEVTLEEGIELPPALKDAVTDLVEMFVARAPLYEGREFDRGRALKAAAAMVQRLVEADVQQVYQMLVDGDFGDEG